MPKTSLDYSKTIIYKLVHKEEPDNHETYVGHTTDFRNRKHEHRKRCLSVTNPKHHLKVYKYIRDNGGWDEWIMLEIEKFPCKDGNEARAREYYWYNQLKCKLNKDVPTRTNKQYCEDYREEIKERVSAKVVCDNCCSIVTYNGLPRHKRTQKCINFKPS